MLSPNRITAILIAVGIASGCGGGGSSSTPAANNAPTAQNLTIKTQNGNSVDVDVSSAISDVDGDALTVSATGPSTLGDISVDGAVLTFDPVQNCAGEETIEYSVTDGELTAKAEILLSCSQTLDISGRVVDSPIANASVTAEVNGETFSSTADEDGYYSLQIETKDISQFIKLSASGSEEHGQQHVALVSLLGEFEQLKQMAAKDTDVSRQMLADTNITNLTTAKYVLAMDANSGQEITSAAELKAAEKAIDTDQLLEIAAAIKLIIDDDNYDLPDGIGSTLSLVTQTDAYNSFVTTVVANKQDDNPLLDAIQAIQQDPEIVAGFSADTLPGAYLEIPAAAPGFMARYGGVIYFFNADGTGTLATDQEGSDQDSAQFEWRINDAEQLVLTLLEPLEYQSFMSYEDTTEDSDAENKYRQLTGQLVVLTTHRQVGAIFTLLAKGSQTDLASVETLTEISIPAVAGTELESHPDFMTRTETDKVRVALRDMDNLETQSFTAEELDGAWGMELYTELGVDVWGGEHKLGFRAELIDFAASNAANWRLLEDGSVQLTMSDGFRQVIQRIDSYQQQHSVLHTVYDEDDVIVAAQVGLAIKQLTTAFETEQLLLDEDQFWASFINAWMHEAWDDGNLDFVPWSGFGWQFFTDGTGNNYSYMLDEWDDDRDGDTSEISLWKPTTTWSVEDGVLQILRAPGTCSERYWVPLLVTEQELFVIETAYCESADYPRGLFFMPRLNQYRPWDILQDIGEPEEQASRSLSGNKAETGSRVTIYPSEQINDIKH